MALPRDVVGFGDATNLHPVVLGAIDGYVAIDVGVV
jgi:hypothetical protein